MRLLNCSLLFFPPRSKYKVKLLNSAKRAVFPLFSAGCDAGISFQQKKRVFWATLDAVLTLAWASESGGVAARVGPQTIRQQLDVALLMGCADYLSRNGRSCCGWKRPGSYISRFLQ